MTKPRYINGRFATQPISGVQRFAVELTGALQALEPGYQLLTPLGGAGAWPSAREVGKRQGQAWEQLELPRQADLGLLLNLGNTAPLLRRQQVIVIHDAGVFSTPEAYSLRFRLWYKFMQSFVIRLGVPVITVSEFSRKEILRHLPVKPAQVEVMPEGADHMQRIRADRSILARHGLTPGRFVLAVGTLAAHKNLASLGRLAQELSARNIPLVIAGGLGGGAFRGASGAPLPQPALYIGRVSDEQLKALYERAGCFVFPSRYEGFGLPAVEAMACGCPVAAADIPALREACGTAAQFCDPATPDDLATCVLEILDNPERQAELRAAGLNHTAGMTWARAALVLHNILNRTLENG